MAEGAGRLFQSQSAITDTGMTTNAQSSVQHHNTTDKSPGTILGNAMSLHIHDSLNDWTSHTLSPSSMLPDSFAYRELQRTTSVASGPTCVVVHVLSHVAEETSYLWRRQDARVHDPRSHL